MNIWQQAKAILNKALRGNHHKPHDPKHRQPTAHEPSYNRGNLRPSFRIPIERRKYSTYFRGPIKIGSIYKDPKGNTVEVIGFSNVRDSNNQPCYVKMRQLNNFRRVFVAGEHIEQDNNQVIWANPYTFRLTYKMA